MEIHQLSEQITVSGQIEAGHIPALKELGVELIICNRPDGEAEGQPSFADIQAATEQAGLVFKNIPFPGGAMTQAQVEEFAECLKGYKRIHAYCRTGNRSSVIWDHARKL